MTRILSGRQSPFLAVALLTLLWLALFFPLLLGGRALFFGDIGLYFVPQLAFQRGELLAGRVPLWNPYILCGTPFVGNPQSWALYPSSLLLAALSPERAAGWIGAGHCLLAAVGTLLFLRRRGSSTGAATLGAAAFGFGGALVSKMQFPNMVQAGAFLPWLLWSADRAIDVPGARRGAAFGAILGLAVLAAHPQMTWMQGWLALAWVLYRRPGRPARATLAGGAALGLLLSAGQWLPVLAAVRESVRPALSLSSANRFLLPPYALATSFLAPNFYGNPATADGYIARGNFWEPCAYAGRAPFALAALALALGGRARHDVRFWGAAFAFALWLAVGRGGGLYIAAYLLLPGQRLFHDPARWLHLASFALAALAAAGADRLRTRFARPALPLALLALTALDLLPFSASLNPTVPEAVYAAARRGLSERLSGAQRVFHRGDRRAWARWVSYHSYAAVAGDEARAFLSSGAPNLPMLVGVRSAGGYEPIRRADYEAVLRALDEGDESRLGPLGVDRVLRGAQGRVESFSPARPRARLDGDGCPVVDRTPQAVRVELPARHRGGTLILADVRAPGWRVRVDGRPARLLSASVRSDDSPEERLLRAVQVPTGARRVDFTYEPGPWRAGLFLSLCGVGILGAAMVFRGRQSGTEH